MFMQLATTYPQPLKLLQIATLHYPNEATHPIDDQFSLKLPVAHAVLLHSLTIKLDQE